MSIDGINSTRMPMAQLDASAPGLPPAVQNAPPGGPSNETMQRILANIAAADRAQGARGPRPIGAPALPPPVLIFSAEDAALILGSMQSRLTDSQLKTAAQGIQMSAQQKQDLHQQALQKLQEASDSANTSNVMGTVTKILGIAAKAIGLVASAVGVAVGVALIVGSSGILTVIGAGIVAVSAIAFAACAVDLTLTIANEVSQHFGGPDLTLHGLMSGLVTEVIKGLGVPEKEAQIVGQIASIAIQASFAIGVAVVSIALAPFTAGGSLAAGVAAAAAVVSCVANIAAGAVNVASGGFSIAQSAFSFAADTARAGKLDIDKLIQQLQMAMEGERERMGDLMRQLDETMGRVTSIIAGGGDTRMQIARRMV